MDDIVFLAVVYIIYPIKCKKICNLYTYKVYFIVTQRKNKKIFHIGTVKQNKIVIVLNICGIILHCRIVLIDMYLYCYIVHLS